MVVNFEFKLNAIVNVEFITRVLKISGYKIKSNPVIFIQNSDKKNPIKFVHCIPIVGKQIKVICILFVYMFVTHDAFS